MTIDLIAQLILGGVSIYQAIRAKRYKAATDTLIESIEKVHTLAPNSVKNQVKADSVELGTAATIHNRVIAVTKRPNGPRR